MNKCLSYLLSASISGIVFLSVTGIPHEVYNYHILSSLFGTIIGCYVAFAFFLLCRNGYSVKLSWLDGMIMGFLFFYWINLKQFSNIYNVGYICLLLLYLLVRNTITIRTNLLYYGGVCTLIFLSIWGYLQYGRLLPSPNPYFTVTGAFYNPAYLGLTLSILMEIAIHVFIFYIHRSPKNKMQWGLALFAILISLPVLIGTNSRTAWISLIVPLLISYTPLPKRITWKTVTLITTLIGIIFILSATFYIIRPSSANGRLLIWKVSWEMMKDRPLTGFGKGGFEANYLYYQARYMTENANEEEKYLAGNTHIAFNEPLRIGVEHGILGLTVYLLFIFILSIYAPHKKTLSIRILKTILLAVALQGLFSYPNLMFPVMNISVIALALLSKSIRQIQTFPIPILYIKAVLTVAILALALPVFNRYSAYHKLYTGIQERSFYNQPHQLTLLVQQLQDDNAVLTYYCNVMQRANDDKETWLMISELEKRHPTPSLFITKGDLLQKQNKLNKAETAYLIAINMVPSKQKAKGRLVFLYKRMGKQEKAKRLAHQLLTEKVKNYGFETFELHEKLKKEFPELNE